MNRMHTVTRFAHHVPFGSDSLLIAFLFLLPVEDPATVLFRVCPIPATRHNV